MSEEWKVKYSILLHIHIRKLALISGIRVQEKIGLSPPRKFWPILIDRRTNWDLVAPFSRGGLKSAQVIRKFKKISQNSIK